MDTYYGWSDIWPVALACIVFVGLMLHEWRLAHPRIPKANDRDFFEPPDGHQNFRQVQESYAELDDAIARAGTTEVAEAVESLQIASTQERPQNEQLPIYGATPPSADFERAFSYRCGGLVRECACGRTTFIDDESESGWYEGELKTLQTEAERHPDQYIGVSYTPSTMTINNREYVMGCPCHAGSQWEKWIEHHALQLADYLDRRAIKLKARAAAMEVKR
jgi:hypothetical protein